jgi:hypothetical protein
MVKVVAETNVKKESGYLYFVNKDGDVARAPMARKGKETEKKQEVVAKAGIQKESGMLYFINKDGNIAAAEMSRGKKAKAK